MGKTQARRKTAAQPKVTAKPKSSPVKKASAKTAGAKKITAASKKKEVDTPFITTLTIENFKSIKSIKLSPKRVNVFIGEPNSGKTNILEALGLLSFQNWDRTYFTDIVRVNRPNQLFHNQTINSPIVIQTNNTNLKVEYSESSEAVFVYHLEEKKTKGSINQLFGLNFESLPPYHENDPLFRKPKYHPASLSGPLFYKYKIINQFKNKGIKSLSQPDGINFPDIIKNNQKIRKIVTETLTERDSQIEFKLALNSENDELNIATEKDGYFHIYNYNSLSETLRRSIFLSTVIHSNNNSVILLDEPDTHSFPPYVKQFAEEVGINEDNQFFITTHNPYLLGSIIEKTPVKELNIYVCRKNKGTTEAICLSEKQLDELTEMGVSSSFFNLDDFYPENA